jgi:NYN domain
MSKIAYIDAQNIHKSLQNYHNWTIDWEKFFIYCHEKFQIDTIKIFFWYVAKYAHFYEKLRKIGYCVCFKETLILPSGEIKWNVDIDIAIIALRDFYESSLDEVFLVTGDGDYNSLVYFWQEKWVPWMVLLPGVANSSVLLTRAAKKNILDIALLKNKIQKSPSRSWDFYRGDRWGISPQLDSSSWT